MALLAEKPTSGDPIFGIRIRPDLKKLIWTTAKAQGIRPSELARRILAEQLSGNEKSPS